MHIAVLRAWGSPGTSGSVCPHAQSNRLFCTASSVAMSAEPRTRKALLQQGMLAGCSCHHPSRSSYKCARMTCTFQMNSKHISILHVPPLFATYVGCWRKLSYWPVHAAEIRVDSRWCFIPTVGAGSTMRTVVIAGRVFRAWHKQKHVRRTCYKYTERVHTTTSCISVVKVTMISIVRSESCTAVCYILLTSTVIMLDDSRCSVTHLTLMTVSDFCSDLTG